MNTFVPGGSTFHPSQSLFTPSLCHFIEQKGEKEAFLLLLIVIQKEGVEEIYTKVKQKTKAKTKTNKVQA